MINGITSEDLVKLEKLWKFIQSDHFNNMYEEIVQQEKFVDAIKAQPQSECETNPFVETSYDMLKQSNDISIVQANIRELGNLLNELTNAIEFHVDPYSSSNIVDIHTRIANVKSLLSNFIFLR